jgi:hypothetical protein
MVLLLALMYCQFHAYTFEELSMQCADGGDLPLPGSP